VFSWVRRYQKPFLGFLLLIVALQLFAWDLKEGGFWNVPSRLFVTVSSFPIKAVNSGIQKVKYVGKWMRLMGELIKENEDLTKEVLALKAEKRELEGVNRENARLRSLLNFQERRPLSTILARVIAEEPTNIFKTILIDKGKKDRLDKGMAVVTAGGVVGQIIRVSSTTSQVLLITDNNSSIDVLIERSRAKGILTGWRGEVCQIKFLGRTEDVTVGDSVITSGLGGVFPKGLDVGKVKEIDKKGWGVFQGAYVYPSIDFGKLEEVLVVLE